MNVLLIAIDTLRADHLSCYGYPRDTSPHLDALAGEGVLLEQAFANGVPTMPSFTTLYTGQHPLTHQVVSHGGQALLHPDSHPLLEQGTSMGRKYLDRLQTYQRSWRARLVLRVKQLLYPLFGRWWQGRRWRRRYRQLELLPAAGAGSAVSTERD